LSMGAFLLSVWCHSGPFARALRERVAGGKNRMLIVLASRAVLFLTPGQLALAGTRRSLQIRPSQ
jgi:hypothetical protein